MIRYAEPDDDFPVDLHRVSSEGEGTATTVLVLEANGDIGGLAAIGPAAGEPGGDTGELSVLSLLPDCWAAGHGDVLLDAVIEELRWAGFSQAVAWVLDGDTRLRQLYEQAGWEADGGEKAGIDRGIVLHSVRYRRPIPTSPFALRFDTAGPDDVDHLLGLYDHLARWMVDNRIDQWGPGEVSAGRIRHYVVDGEMTLLRSGDQLAGSVGVTWEDPFAWDEGVAAAGYVHQLMVHRDYAGRGLGRRLLQRAERLIYDQGLRRVRLDCVADNVRLRHYYERAGYRHLGETDYGGRRDVRPGALYEKRLTGRPVARA